MSQTATKKKKIFIFVDLVAKAINKANPDKREVTRESLAADPELDMNKQIFYDWSSGRGPQIIARLFRLKELSGMDWNEFMTQAVQVKSEE